MSGLSAARDVAPLKDGLAGCYNPDEVFFIGDINAEGLFLPGEDPAATDRLLDTLWRRRQAIFLALTLSIQKIAPALAENTGFNTAVEVYKNLDASRRRILMEHPVMRIWLREMSHPPSFWQKSPEREALLQRRLSDFHQALMGENGLARRNFPLPYEFQRYDIDPLLAEAAPPSYLFENIDEKLARDEKDPYTKVFAQGVVDAALRRIAFVWPEATEIFPKFVKTVVHLPDMSSRSCSAQRYAGAILLSAEETLLAVEESLIHECGHQILYCVMELDPIIRNDGRKFTLPWSGSERDAYGYFHATYIYVILAMFFERALDRDPAEAAAVAQRLTAILHGLDKALPDFEGADFFTPAGSRFFEKLADYGMSLIERNRHRLTTLKETSLVET